MHRKEIENYLHFFLNDIRSSIFIPLPYFFIQHTIHFFYRKSFRKFLLFKEEIIDTLYINLIVIQLIL